MALTTQISGSSPSHTISLFQLEEMLDQYHVKNAHPFPDGFIFTQNSSAPGLVSALWTPYETNLDYYERIAASDVYIVNNDDGLITNAMARGILYALTQQKPILLFHQPVFDKNVSGFIRSLITRASQQFIVLDIFTASEARIRKAFHEAPKTVQYELSPRDIFLISATLREHFRDLLSKDMHGAKTSEPEPGFYTVA